MISEGLKSNSTLTELNLEGDEKEQTNRRNNKEIKKREKEKEKEKCCFLLSFSIFIITTQIQYSQCIVSH